MRILPFFLLLVLSAAHAAGLNDTGIGFCGDDTTNTANCATVGTDGGTHPRQDARYGRDAAAAAGQLTKTGAGGKGFDFTKIANDGSVLPESAALGSNPTDWACTRDNVTGLIWEVKTASGLRGQGHTYTWYNSNATTNGGNVGTASGGACATTGRCDTEKFVADVNAAGLCGASDWRMPAVKELEGIADFGRTNPVIDTTYFSNTLGSNYWTVSPFVADSNYAWSVNFNQGHASYFTRNSGYSVRLVRGAVAPTASAVSIAGTAQVGQTLTGNYTYADANNDPQGASTFRWLRNGAVITGATASMYTLVTADLGNTITFEVTPLSTVAPTTGTPVVSTAMATVTTPAAPTASAVSISGTAQVGQQLTGSYTYADANNDPQGTGTFRWLRSGTAITDATSSTYTLISADQGNTITFEVTPVASTGSPSSGTPVVSSATASVLGVGTPAAPTASAVSISGTAQVGQTLTGSYIYADANNDPQGTSTFRWLRNGTAITGATSSTYTLVAADQGNTITFEVTPVSTIAPTTGTHATSGATITILPAGYVYQGGLTWMPATFTNNWSGANTYCTTTTINGQIGWRLPTLPELSALYTSGAMNGQGWILSLTWPSTPYGSSGLYHYYFSLFHGYDGWSDDANYFYVTCVR